MPCAPTGVPFILNDRPDLALEVGADGSTSARTTHRPPWPAASSGRTPSSGSRPTVRSTGRGHEAAGDVVSYISAGPVEATPTKPGRPGTGLDYLRLATGGSQPVPVFVTGGVTPEKIPRWPVPGPDTSSSCAI